MTRCIYFKNKFIIHSSINLALTTRPRQMYPSQRQIDHKFAAKTPPWRPASELRISYKNHSHIPGSNYKFPTIQIPHQSQTIERAIKKNTNNFISLDGCMHHKNEVTIHSYQNPTLTTRLVPPRGDVAGSLKKKLQLTIHQDLFSPRPVPLLLLLIVECLRSCHSTCCHAEVFAMVIGTAADSSRLPTAVSFHGFSTRSALGYMLRDFAHLSSR